MSEVNPMARETNDKIRLEIRRFCLTTFEINFVCFLLLSVTVKSVDESMEM